MSGKTASCADILWIGLMQIVNLRTGKMDIVIVLSGTLAGDISAIQGRNFSPPVARAKKQRELSGHVDNRGRRREVGTRRLQNT
jgi:hypothetical protein